MLASLSVRDFHQLHDVSCVDDERVLLRDQIPERLGRSEEHTSELQSPCNLVCRLLLEKKKEVFITIDPIPNSINTINQGIEFPYPKNLYAMTSTSSTAVVPT